MTALLWVALGGALGAVARYQIGLWLMDAAQALRFPIATLLVNVLGCLAVGAFWAWAQRLEQWDEALRLGLMVGLLGGFTTFSAFGLETLLMFKRGDTALALAYVSASLVLGGLAVWVGFTLVDGFGGSLSS
jgi:CrcB protein